MGRSSTPANEPETGHVPPPSGHHAVDVRPWAARAGAAPPAALEAAAPTIGAVAASAAADAGATTPSATTMAHMDRVEWRRRFTSGTGTVVPRRACIGSSGCALEE